MNYVFDARVIQDHFPGIGRYAYNLLLNLPAQLQKDETLLVLSDTRAKNTRFTLPSFGNHGGSRVRLVEYHMPIFGLQNILQSPKPIPRHAALVHYTYYVRPRASSPTSITSIYDTISFAYPGFVPSARARWVIRFAHELAIRASTLILTISNAAARDLENRFPRTSGKIIVTPLAADEVFKPQPRQAINDVRAKFQITEPFVLYLASNKPHKNLAKLVEAWKICNSVWSGNGGSKKRPQLIIAGHQDPRYPQAQQFARQYGIENDIRFIGEVSDLEAAALYSGCELFVFPSLHEGFGLTPLEAMSCGAPVICSNTSSLPEVVGNAGLLFDPNDVDDLANAIQLALNDDYLLSHLRENSLRQAARFSWKETARLTIEAYREVIRYAHRSHL
jgi:alpha-1,3-rhamnosyl/mannosyltransferase